MGRCFRRRSVQVTASKSTVNDACLHGRQLSGWSNEYVQLSTGTFSGSTAEVQLGPIQIFSTSTNQAVQHLGHCWPSSHIFASLLPGDAIVSVEGHRQRSLTLQSHRWDEVSRVASDRGYRTVGFAISEELWEEYFIKATGGRPKPVSYGQTSRVSSDDVLVFQGKLFDIISKSMDMTDSAECTFDPDLWLDGFLIDFINLTTQDEAGWERWPLSSTREFIVKKSVDYIEEHHSGDIRLVDICGNLRISPRTLEYAFREQIGISPSRYILMRRLAGVRKDILLSDLPQQISTYAVDRGFRHLGRFSQVYSRVFGESPSQTRSRIR